VVVQGRHVLPVTIIVPLLSAVLIGRRPLASPGWYAWAGLSITSFAVFQFLALYLNGRHYAVGPKAPVLFFTAAFWSPPLGWKAWIPMALVGAALCAASAALLWRSKQAGETPAEGLRAAT
jgi:hypothetical protein